MSDNLREAYEKVVAKERADAFHLAFKAGFRAAEFRDHEHIAIKGHAQAATDAEIRRCEEKALHSAPVE
jgi:hypothetical protein